MIGKSRAVASRVPSALSAYRGWRRLADKAFTSAIRGSFESAGPGSVLQAPIRIEGEQRISIGGGVFIGSGSWLQTLHQPPHPPGRLVIGDGTKCSGLCVISAASRITLGRAVLLGRNVVIVDHNHASGNPALAIAEQGIDELEPVEVQEGAWLAQNVVVCPGVTIGAHAVVGANSVVTRDVPPHSLAVGAPARVIRRTESSGADASAAFASRSR